MGKNSRPARRKTRELLSPSAREWLKGDTYEMRVSIDALKTVTVVTEIHETLACLRKPLQARLRRLAAEARRENVTMAPPLEPAHLRELADALDALLASLDTVGRVLKVADESRKRLHPAASATVSQTQWISNMNELFRGQIHDADLTPSELAELARLAGLEEPAESARKREQQRRKWKVVKTRWGATRRGAK